MSPTQSLPTTPHHRLLHHCDVGQKRVADFAESLRFRLANPDVISWGFFWATKRISACRIFCSAKLERDWFANVGRRERI